MMRIARSIAFALVALVLAGVPADAQWQVPNHAVPIGQGAGFTGFRNATPSDSGSPFVSKGASTDPGFVNSPTVTGNWTFAPSSGNAVTINPAAGTTARGVTVQQSGPSSGSTTAASATNCTGGASFLAYNYFCIDGEGSNLSGASSPYTTFGAVFGLVTGGANSTGNKTGLSALIYHAGDSNPGTVRDTVAFGANAISSASEGGTATSIGNAKGTLFGIGIQANLISGATNYFEVSGGEIDVGIGSGASAAYRFGWNIASVGSAQGAVLDGGLAIGANGTSWGVGVLFTNANGSQPITSTGTAIGTDGQSAAIGSVIDFSSWSCTNYFIRGVTSAATPGRYYVDCNANIVAATLTIGAAGLNTGSIAVFGTTSGHGTLQGQAAMGTPTWTLPTGTGTFAVSASSPLTLNATTGALTCSTCVTSAASLTANQLVIGSGSQGEQSLGSLGSTTTVLHGNASGAPSFAAVVSADLNITTTSCTNQFVTAISAGGVGTCTTDTLASAQHANQGTTTTVLHGNASGNPSWAAISLSADVTGILGSSNGGAGSINGALKGNGSGTVSQAACADLSNGATGCSTATGTSGATIPLLNGANTWSGVNTYTLSQAANTSTDGIALADTTAATVGNQQYSPRLRFTGQGWKTNATAASQMVDWVAEQKPAQGAANPSSQLVFSSQINGGGYNERFILQDDGATLFVKYNGQTQSQFLVGVAGTYHGVLFTDGAQVLTGSTTNVPVGLLANNSSVLTLLTSGVVKFAQASSFTANGSVATTMTSLGPTGSHTTIQEWLTVQNSSGTVRYIPAY